MSKSSMILVTLKKGQGQTYDMLKKVLSLCISGIYVKSLTQMITDLSAFVYPIGYNG